MVWFNDWWVSIGLLGQIMACAAIPMTLIMILQLILLLMGGGPGEGADTDVDSDLDTDFDADMDADFDTDFDVDSDGAGFKIRNFLKGAIDPSLVKHAYIPDIDGRERRKNSPSKEGKLGVEGMSPEILIEAMRRAGATMGEAADVPQGERITKSDMFELGLSGGHLSAARRLELTNKLGLPAKISTGALLDILNVIMTREELYKLEDSLTQAD